MKGENEIPTRVTYGHKVLFQNDRANASATGSYRPITFLPLTWKLMTRMIAEETYNYLRKKS